MGSKIEKIAFSEKVLEEVGNEPNYEAALSEIKKLQER